MVRTNLWCCGKQKFLQQDATCFSLKLGGSLEAANLPDTFIWSEVFNFAGLLRNRQSSFLIDDLLDHKCTKSKDENGIQEDASPLIPITATICCHDDSEEDTRSRCEGDKRFSPANITPVVAAVKSKLTDLTITKYPPSTQLNNHSTSRRHPNQSHSSSPSRSSSISSSTTAATSRRGSHSSSQKVTQSSTNESRAKIAFLTNDHRQSVHPCTFWPSQYLHCPEQAVMSQHYRSNPAATTWYPVIPHTFPTNMYSFMFPQSLQILSNPRSNEINQHLAAIGQSQLHQFAAGSGPEKMPCFYNFSGTWLVCCVMIVVLRVQRGGSCKIWWSKSFLRKNSGILLHLLIFVLLRVLLFFTKFGEIINYQCSDHSSSQQR